MLHSGPNRFSRCSLTEWLENFPHDVLVLKLASMGDILLSVSALLLVINECAQAKCIALPRLAYLLCLSPKVLVGCANKSSLPVVLLQDETHFCEDVCGVRHV